MKVVYNNKYTQQIYNILEPMIGEYIARAVIRTQTAKIGYDEESLIQRDLMKLSEGIKTGLNIFLGSETASKVAAKIAQIK